MCKETSVEGRRHVGRHSSAKTQNTSPAVHLNFINVGGHTHTHTAACVWRCERGLRICHTV